MLSSVLVVGLGLMGSNLALKLRSQGLQVYGEDVNQDAYLNAINMGAIEDSSCSEVDLDWDIDRIVRNFHTLNVIIYQELTTDIRGKPN